MTLDVSILARFSLFHSKLGQCTHFAKIGICKQSSHFDSIDTYLFRIFLAVQFIFNSTEHNSNPTILIFMFMRCDAMHQFGITELNLNIFSSIFFYLCFHFLLPCRMHSLPCQKTTECLKCTAVALLYDQSIYTH